MKLSDLISNSQAPQPVEPLPYPCSQLADPPITATEAKAAETTVCRWHGGQLTHMNVDGKVYFCGVGRQYFRHSKQQDGMYAPLRYGW